MTRETAKGRCPACGGARYKVHTFKSDIAVCQKCGNRENIKYRGKGR